MSTWTKADYEFFAQVINNTPMSREERVYLSNRFGDFFIADNSSFDWQRWNDAIFSGKLTRRSGSGKYGGWHKATYEMTAKALSGPAFLHTYYGLNVTLSPDTQIALISAFGAAFERDNSQFDWDRFRRAANAPVSSEIRRRPEVRRHPEVRVRQHARRMK
jgi:hypothetical protein